MQKQATTFSEPFHKLFVALLCTGCAKTSIKGAFLFEATFSDVFLFKLGFASQYGGIIRTKTHFLFAKIKMKLARKILVTKNKLLWSNKQKMYNICCYYMQYHKKKYYICQKYYMICSKCGLYQKKITIKNATWKLIHKYTINKGHVSAVNSVQNVYFSRFLIYENSPLGYVYCNWLPFLKFLLHLTL